MKYHEITTRYIMVIISNLVGGIPTHMKTRGGKSENHEISGWRF